MVNHVILIGRLVKDAVLKETPEGTKVATFTLAIANPTGSKEQKSTSFIDCIAWKEVGVNVSKYCKTGSLLAVEGRINQRFYQTKDARNVNKVEVVVYSTQFLEPKKTTDKAKTTEETPLPF